MLLGSYLSHAVYSLHILSAWNGIILIKETLLLPFKHNFVSGIKPHFSITEALSITPASLYTLLEVCPTLILQICIKDLLFH